MKRTKMKFERFAVPGLCLGAMFLTGCAASYIEPTGTETARIRLYAPQSSTAMNTHATGHESGQCENPMFLGMVGGAARWRTDPPLGIAGAAALDPLTFIERKIPAGKTYLLTTRTLSGVGVSCVTTVSFLPIVGADYEVKVTQNGGQCLATVKKVSAGPDQQAIYSSEVSMVQQADCTKGLH
jgi:hypothetical protein